jgi:hypothetical protein
MLELVLPMPTLHSSRVWRKRALTKIRTTAVTGTSRTRLPAATTKIANKPRGNISERDENDEDSNGWDQLEVELGLTKLVD